MPNGKEITAASSNILLIGDSGSYKTRFARQTPVPYVFDFDAGNASLAGADVDFDVYRDKARTPNAQGVLIAAAPNEMEKKAGLYKWATGWPAFFNRMNQIGNEMDKGTCKYKTIHLDSLTFLSMMAMNHVLDQQKEPIMHQGSYGAQQEYIKLILGQLTAWPIRLVATAHVQRNENDLTGITEKLPLMTGKLAGFLSVFFDEVYYLEAAKEKTKEGFPQIICRTVQTPDMRQAKSRWGVPDGTPLDFKTLSKFYPGGG